MTETPASPSYRWLTATCLCVIVLAALPWFLAIGRVPSPWEFVVVLSLCLVGGACLTGYGLFRASKSPRLPGYISWLVGMSALGAIAFFIVSVFVNDDAGIPVFGHADKPSPAVTKIRLFDLNVLNGYPDFEDHEKRFAETVEELRRINADVLVLQEVWNTAEHGNMADRLRQALGFNYAYARANGSLTRIGFEEGSAILSRFPILEAKRIRMQPRRPFWETRIALLTKIDLGGETLTLVGVHLSNSEAADDQAAYLMQITHPHRPDIIAGDFNAEPPSRAIKAVLRDRFVEAFPKNASAEPWIDHVFLSPSFHEKWAIERAEWVVASEPAPGVRAAISDHDGLLVDLRRR